MILFTTKTCKPCNELKVWLADNNINIEEREVHKNPQDVKLFGFKVVPSLVVENELGEAASVYSGNEEIRPYLESISGS